MAATERHAPAVTNASLYDSGDWWGDSVRGLRQLRKLVPARFAYFDGVMADWRARDVLDLGCGGGFMAETLAQRGATVVGIDPCAPAIAAAISHARVMGLPIDYRVGWGESLPLASGSLDVIVCVDVLEHVDSLDTVLEEIRRVLKPGGLLLFDTINCTPLATFVMVTMAERVLRLLPRGTHDPRAFIAPEQLRTKLEALDFSVSPMVGFGPRGLDRDLDFTFGVLPTKAILYLGHARLA
jgi:2-polyprenyl-6-hydroxyphenyl methylase/3-demethylubiquinone-9 3-methyltransferase